MAPTNETGLVHHICKAIAKEYPNAWVFKVHGSPFQMSGVPDLLIGVRGRLVGLEVKFQHPGESVDSTLSRVTPGQRTQIARLLAAGCHAAAVMSVDEALTEIRKALAQPMN